MWFERGGGGRGGGVGGGAWGVEGGGWGGGGGGWGVGGGWRVEGGGWRVRDDDWGMVGWRMEGWRTKDSMRVGGWRAVVEGRADSHDVSLHLVRAVRIAHLDQIDRSAARIVDHLRVRAPFGGGAMIRAR